MPEPISEAVRARFKSQKTKNTAPELAVRRMLHAAGLRYRLDMRADPSVRSKPDIVFTRPRVAVYIDGCFWHGCAAHFIPPKNNAAWWAKKIAENRARDKRHRKALRDCGWTVLTYWEHDEPRWVFEQIAMTVARGGTR